MSHAVYAPLAAGVRTFERMDQVANNLANVDTPGFRAQRAVFRVVSGDGAGTPAQDRIAERYLTTDAVVPDMRAGAVQTTGETAHLALDGDGFLKLQGEGGPLYTRDGTLRIADDGLLVHQSGAPLLTVGGQPLRLQPGGFEVTPEGIVIQAGAERGRLAAVRFDEPDALIHAGRNLYEGSGAVALPAQDTTFIQGALERSNVDPMRELIALIQLSRFHEAYANTLETLDRMHGQLNERVGRVQR
jgi:flagellar basal body rod protein FlgG